MTFAEKVARNMKALRAKRGWRQKDLADKTGIHQQVIAQYEIGRSCMNLERAADIADAFNCSLDELVSDCINEP